MVHFTGSGNINWVFWDKIIFSTNEQNWEYSIGSFVGQSGGGKSIEIVWGGKYEFLDLPFSKLNKGFSMLTSGKNSIIRLQGKENQFDYRPTEKDLNNFKNALKFEADSQVINGKITRGK